VLRVLKDILEACSRKPVNTSGPTRQFKNQSEFDALVQWVKDSTANVVLCKLFLYSGRCSVMQEIWIEDKQNPAVARNPLQSYAIVHVHHHADTRVNRVEDIETRHLDTVDAVNVRHLVRTGARYQGDNPFFQTFIEPSGGGTLKVFPESWKCSNCWQINFRSNMNCRGPDWKCPSPGCR